MSLIVTFGNVFTYEEKDYVFLAKIDDIIYAAEILNCEKSVQYKKIVDRSIKNSTQSYKLRQNALYCFVELKTKEFDKRVAFYGKPEHNYVPDFLENVVCSLESDDLKNLQKELLNDDVAVPKALKEQIKDIKIKKTLNRSSWR